MKFKRKVLFAGVVLVILGLVAFVLHSITRPQVRFKDVGRSQVMTPGGIAVSMAICEGRMIGAIVSDSPTEGIFPPFAGGSTRVTARSTSPAEVSLFFGSPSGSKAVNFIVDRRGSVTVKMPDGSVQSASEGSVFVLNSKTGNLKTLPIQAAGSREDFLAFVDRLLGSGVEKELE